MLCAVGGCAGFVDAIAGGGGLLTVPALLGVGLDPHVALGTNKAQSAWGSGAALLTYGRAGLVDRARAPATFALALGGSLVGAIVVQHIAPAALRPIVVGLLAAVALVLLVRPRLGADVPVDPGHAPRGARAALVTGLLAAGIGFYDGFFGPGTGTFAIMGFALALGQPLVRASGNAKVVNFASNLAALAAFASAGRVVWSVALPMAGAQMLGAAAGAHTTSLRGSPLVRKVVVAVALLVCVRLGWDWLR